MMGKIFTKIFGSRNQRFLNSLKKTIQQINELEESLAALSDADLTAKTAEYKARFAEGETLEQLLPEAFATAREASKRALGMRHFDVQLIGGMVLNMGKIAEMRTGEGKTLVATLPVYLNALSGKGVHVITVNDYLARRDAEWMGQLYRFLGLTVGVIYTGQDPAEKLEAYAADITYGTNNEFGFDYLRDNMAFSINEKAQRPLNFAVIDEVDSILIDEARTPLIISGAVDDNTDLYRVLNGLVKHLTPQLEEDGPGDFTLDEKSRQAHLTESGHENVEKLLISKGLLEAGASLYEPANLVFMHHLTAALRANHLYQKDVHYLVKDNEIIIVDEFTGRGMPGRRWSDGLHQAVEAKENVTIQKENQTLASITFQNYFRMYDKLSGMTGTADTEAYEFQQIYGLEVAVIPTNRPMVREDYSDLFFMTQQEKYAAIIEDIVSSQKQGRPVLVGTTSIEVSEQLSGLLKKKNVAHEVLNAKQPEREADIVAQAGMSGAVTIATNMAGRGTDIVLGGNLTVELEKLGERASDAHKKAAQEAWQGRHDAVLEAGGLHIIGTERHESRRIDNQLRGRAGRQGDQGSSRFYLSLEDNLLRIFAAGRFGTLMQKIGMEEGDAVEHRWLNRAIENAQRKLESYNFDIRKQLLDYDDVANDQRKVIYEQRDELMASDDLSAMVLAILTDVTGQLFTSYVPPQSIEEQWDIAGLELGLKQEYLLDISVQSWLDDDDSLDAEDICEKLKEACRAAYQEKMATLEPEVARHLEKVIMLQTLDGLWREHLAAMDYLRQGIHLRGYAQKNPKQEYKREGFEMFSELLERFKQDSIGLLFKVRVQAERDIESMEAQRITNVAAKHPDSASAYDQQGTGEKLSADELSRPVETYVREQPKVGRNEPCPCGSGKKYKQCHGRLD